MNEIVLRLFDSRHSLIWTVHNLDSFDGFVSLRDRARYFLDLFFAAESCDILSVCSNGEHLLIEHLDK